MSRESPLPDLAALREEYAAGGLAEGDLAADPMTMFRAWLAEALAAGLYEPTGMVVSSVGADGAPSSRMVLLKGLRPEVAVGPEGAAGQEAPGFVFFTNRESRKGGELGAEPRCSLLFPWHPLERQVRVDGVAEPLPRAEVEAYFAGRPRGSQLGAWASPQSRVVAGREALAAAYDEVSARFEGRDVPVPAHWGGFVVRPESVEFWQGRPGRMHDRLVYRRAGTGWRTERLAP
ncbi:pyridoxamine 5'-phosphate oxidase [Nocardioides ochotonae]|uniref:pyridoxamine 5'-phosphate oxidase n=1 Tax=Nocardioides ochotonae TaxID=2685869 RepID=UPI00140E9009|nr:pyridoxamine 5'-phosphate oxidase [Nocardioides ochotonae]